MTGSEYSPKDERYAQPDTVPHYSMVGGERLSVPLGQAVAFASPNCAADNGGEDDVKPHARTVSLGVCVGAVVSAIALTVGIMWGLNALGGGSHMQSSSHSCRDRGRRSDSGGSSPAEDGPEKCSHDEEHGCPGDTRKGRRFGDVRNRRNLRPTNITVPTGASDAQILARATKIEVREAVRDGRGWIGGPVKIEIISAGRIAQGKGKRADANRFESSSEVKRYVEVRFNVTNRASTEVDLRSLKYALIDGESRYFNIIDDFTQEGRDSAFSLHPGESMEVAAHFSMSGKYRKGSFFFSSPFGESGSVFYRIGDLVENKGMH